MTTHSYSLVLCEVLLATCMEGATMGDDSPLSYLVDSWLPVTEREISRFEKSIKSTLPDDYRAFILQRNGGKFAVPVHRATEGSSFRGGGVDALFSFSCPEELGWRDIEKVWRMHAGRIPANSIPIGMTGEDLILLDTRNSHVLYWVRDNEFDVLPEDNQLFLAEDFNTYLKALRVEDVAERRRNSLERDEPFISIESLDTARNDRWLRDTHLEALAPRVRLKLFKTACDSGNIAVVRHLLEEGAIDPKSADACRLADEAGFGEIVLLLLKAGANPSEFTKNRYRPQNCTKAFLRAWKSGQFR